MKTFTVICILVLGVGLAVGDSSEELNVGPSKCQQCLKLLGLVRATRDSSELIQRSVDDENNEVCESVCSQRFELNDSLYVSLKDCQMCVQAINKINKHYQGHDLHALSSALSYGCSMFEFSCKRFIKANRLPLMHILQTNKDAHMVCMGVHKC